MFLEPRFDPQGLSNLTRPRSLAGVLAPPEVKFLTFDLKMYHCGFRSTYDPRFSDRNGSPQMLLFQSTVSLHYPGPIKIHVKEFVVMILLNKLFEPRN